MTKTTELVETIRLSYLEDEPNYQYVEQVLMYIQIARLDFKLVDNVLPLFLHYIKIPSQVSNAENIFIGLCAFFQVKPAHYLAYLTGRSELDIEHSRLEAIHYLSKME